MANWSNEPQPFGANHAPLLTGVSNADGKTPVPVAVDPATGRILTSTTGSTGAGLVTVAYDYVAYTNTNSTTDTFVYKSGGSGGTLVATVTIVYTDSTKTTISTVTKT